MKVYIVLLVLSFIAVALADRQDCDKRRTEAEKSHDAYVPNCYPNGDYKPEQCRKGSGGRLFCFCVNKAGDVQGPPTEGHRDCN
ncbi:U20-hexatoxin-Hi1a-like [Parasteatoda tepidariorum]|uniref:U20-hexatoxin-Hi1a-like n=1 Tax=Parasteatoda tepidariorum TaxID=114398 RepID=UPI00077FAB34|nr:saxiphilin-like [Parasteatoda tepidariorum]